MPAVPSPVAPHWLKTSKALRAGLPFREVHQLQTILGISLHQVAEYLNIAERTLMLRKKTGRLNATESDRLYRLRELVQQSMFLMDNNRAAVEAWWMQPCRGLGGRVPWEEAKTEAGARAIERLMGQLIHGVFP
ncbi:MAG: antitoxin Xre-like helix-turn-helix domain-containing protein [Gemmatales bacterium]